MSYIRDRVWQIAKSRFRGTEHENNWLYITTYYNHIGGRELSMYCTPEEHKTVRILGKLDKQDLVLTINEQKQYKYYPMEQLLQSPKVFSYADEPMEQQVTRRIRKGTIYGKYVCHYYVIGGEK